MARSMIVHSKLNEKFWAEAISTAVYIRNRTTTTALDSKTPYEVWFNKKPSVSHLKVFGCLAIAANKTENHKFKPKGTEMIMVGYSEVSKGYRLFNPANKRVIVNRNVKFFEENFQTEKSCEDNDHDKEVVLFDFEEIETQSNPACEDEEQEERQEIIVPTRYTRGRPKIIRTGHRGRPRIVKYKLHLAKHVKPKTSENITQNVPQNYEDAVSGKDALIWKCSIEDEIKSLEKNNTWNLIDLPPGKRAIKCRWVYTIKKDEKGAVVKYKSRFVAKGCSQRYGIGFKETFSPVVRYATIRLILALACEYELYLHQIDVASAYVNSNLHDEVSMQQPDGFIDQQNPHKVLKLNKALYGLKQSGREWNFHLDSKLKKMGFKSCISEPCVYVQHNQGNFNIIVVYVDDLIIGSKQLAEVHRKKSLLSKEFDVVDGGDLHYFLGMEIKRKSATGDIQLCQKHYIEEMIHEYDIKNCKTASTPLDPGFQWNCTNDKCKREDPLSYQSLIGSLMYLALASRSDILHSVIKLAKCVKDPHSEHCAAAKHILRYLQATREFMIHYTKTGKPIECFVDADWAGDKSDRKSYTGCVFIAAGAAVYWESKKQNLVALSSTEAEYVALSVASKEAVFVQKLLSEIGIPIKGPITLNGDNQSAQQLVKNPVFHARSKHIDIKFHYIRELYKNKEIELNYVSSIYIKMNCCSLVSLKLENG